MRKFDRQSELQENNKLPIADDKQNSQTDVNSASLELEKSSNLSGHKINPSRDAPSKDLVEAMDKLRSGQLVGETNLAPLAPEELFIEQDSLEETLEKELTSSSLQDDPLSYAMMKANKLENAIRVVNRDCDNLIAVCVPPEDAPVVQPSNGNFTSLTSKRMLAIASIALLATCGGVYAYVDPENPVKHALHSKIAEIANQPAAATLLQPSARSYASLAGMTQSSQLLAVYVEESESSDLQQGKAPITTQVLNLADAKDADTPIVREVTPQAPRSKAPQPKATETVDLSERFGTSDTFVGNQPVTKISLTSKTAGTSNQIADTNSRLAALPKHVVKLETISPKKRNVEVVKQIVLQANDSATLDNSQVNILVSKLAKGDCLSSALHGIFGENKISPVFVRRVLTDMENRC